MAIAQTSSILMTPQTISPQKTKDLLDSGKAVLIDVREQEEYAASHIPGAVHLPLSQVCCMNLPDFQHTTLIVHCKSGMRSTVACKKLMDENKELKIFSLEGGIEAWQAAGFHTRKSTPPLIPIMRQVSITAGFFVILGIISSQFIHPKFIIISEIAAVGLIFYGLTGWCGMAKILQKMPWNQED